MDSCGFPNCFLKSKAILMVALWNAVMDGHTSSSLRNHWTMWLGLACEVENSNVILVYNDGQDCCWPSMMPGWGCSLPCCWEITDPRNNFAWARWTCLQAHSTPGFMLDLHTTRALQANYDDLPSQHVSPVFIGSFSSSVGHPNGPACWRTILMVSIPP